MSAITEAQVRDAMSRVIDPELRKDLIELEMVRAITIDGGHVTVGVALTIPGCPLKATIDGDVQREVGSIEGVTSVLVDFTSMSEDERATLATQLRGGRPPAPAGTAPLGGSPLAAKLTLLANRTPYLWLGVAMHRTGRDRRRLAEMKALSIETGVPLIAVNDVLYATPEDRPLQDILTCIREKTSIDKAGRKLAANAERHLKTAAEMARLFTDAPEALSEIARLMEALSFDLSQVPFPHVTA